MRILISGVAGFIGSHLADGYLARGHRVVGLDNFITGSQANLAHLVSVAEFELRPLDVAAPFSIEGPFDLVIHAAALASPRDYLAHPIESLDVGAAGTRNLLEIARRDHARFLVTSTSETYGDPAEHPQKETYWGNVNPIGPRSCYDESKRYSEALTMAYHRVYSLPTRIARIFNTYGPRMQAADGRVVPELIGQALAGRALTIYGDGAQTRSFCYVSDLVDGLMRLAESGDALPVNLGNPAEITIGDFAAVIRRLAGSSSAIEYHPLPQDDPRRRRPDIARAQNLLGWEPRVPLEQGLRETIEYFRARRPQSTLSA
ncbi:MAG: SDR family oxidoreductase [Bryobacterales bacterium]|nr:SDR family oxidoreductase [Bryobacterales bacterium]